MKNHLTHVFKKKRGREVHETKNPDQSVRPPGSKTKRKNSDRTVFKEKYIKWKKEIWDEN